MVAIFCFSAKKIGRENLRLVFCTGIGREPKNSPTVQGSKRHRIPDPGVKKAPDPGFPIPGSGSATLEAILGVNNRTANIQHILSKNSTLKNNSSMVYHKHDLKYSIFARQSNERMVLYNVNLRWYM